MGQAKRKRTATLSELLRKSIAFDFPPSPWEAAICRELRARESDILVVPRISNEQLALVRMSAGECHANARWCAEQDPSGKTRAVTGWWVQWPNFVLHSVIEIDGQFFCVTPTPFNETEIPFIPDPKINWIEDGEVYSAIRDGQIIGPGLRAFPEYTMAQNAIVRERLLRGMNPLEASNFTEEEMADLRARYIKGDDPLL